MNDRALPPGERNWDILIDALRFYATAEVGAFAGDDGAKAIEALNAVGEEVRPKPKIIPLNDSEDDGRKAVPIGEVADQVLAMMKKANRSPFITDADRTRVSQLVEASKNDNTIIVGSDIRELAMLIKKLDRFPPPNYAEGPCRKCGKTAQTHVIHEVADFTVCLHCWDAFVSNPDDSITEFHHEKMEPGCYIQLTMAEYTALRQVSAKEDWNAVEKFTGCGKMFGAQGRAPTIAEMIQHLKSNIVKTVAESEHKDMIETGIIESIESVIATLILRAQPHEAQAKAFHRLLAALDSISDPEDKLCGIIPGPEGDEVQAAYDYARTVIDAEDGAAAMEAKVLDDIAKAAVHDREPAPIEIVARPCGKNPLTGSPVTCDIVGGKYMQTCSTCGRRFLGHKHSYTCLECMETRVKG